MVTTMATTAMGFRDKTVEQSVEQCPVCLRCLLNRIARHHRATYRWLLWGLKIKVGRCIFGMFARL
jgi:hypothetical protein